MALGEAYEPSLHVMQGGEGVSLSPKLVQPELEDSSLDHGLNPQFGGL